MYRILLFAAIVASVCGLILISTRGNQSSPLPNPPELRAHNHELSLTLHAIADSNGREPNVHAECLCGGSVASRAIPLKTKRFFS